MDNAVRMGVIERARDLNAVALHLRGGKCAAGERLKRPAGDMLHHDEGKPLGLLDVVNGANVRVTQSRDGTRLTKQLSAGFAGEIVVQHLDRHRATEHGVVGAINRTHAAGADGRHDVVMTESLSAGELHTHARPLS